MSGPGKPVLKLNILGSSSVPQVIQAQKTVSVPSVPPVSTLPKKDVKKTPKLVVSSDDESDNDDNESLSLSEDSDGFYVEVSLSCTNDDGDSSDQIVIFNFGSESNYMDKAENGFDDLESTFEDTVSTYFPECTYSGEWEENNVHGSELPDDYEGPVVDIQED